MTDAQAQKSAIAALESIRYSGKEYVWINDMQVVMVMHPIRPELNGKNLSLNKDPNGKPLFTEQGEALFTHFGLSGPLVLSASTYIEDITKHRYICEFDLKPALDEKTLYDRLTRDFAEQGSHSALMAQGK